MSAHAHLARHAAGDESVVEGTTAPRTSAVPGLVGAVLLGLFAGGLGTFVHLNLWPIPDRLGPPWPVVGRVLPWGAALALVMVGSLHLWWTRRTGRPAHGALLGSVAAVFAWALWLMPGPDRLGVAWTQEIAAAHPAALLASRLWLIGVPVVVALVAAWGSAERRGRGGAKE